MFLEAPVWPLHIQWVVSVLSLAMNTYCQFIKSKPFLLLSVSCNLWYFYETTLTSNSLYVTQWKIQDQLELHLLQYSKTSFESSSYTYKVVLFKKSFFFSNILLRIHRAELHEVLLHGAFLCISRTISVTMYYIKDLTWCVDKW